MTYGDLEWMAANGHEGARFALEEQRLKAAPVKRASWQAHLDREEARRGQPPEPPRKEPSDG